MSDKVLKPLCKHCGKNDGFMTKTGLVFLKCISCGSVLDIEWVNYWINAYTHNLQQQLTAAKERITQLESHNYRLTESTQEKFIMQINVLNAMSLFNRLLDRDFNLDQDIIDDIELLKKHLEDGS